MRLRWWWRVRWLWQPCPVVRWEATKESTTVGKDLDSTCRACVAEMRNDPATCGLWCLAMSRRRQVGKLKGCCGMAQTIDRGVAGSLEGP